MNASGAPLVSLDTYLSLGFRVQGLREVLKTEVHCSQEITSLRHAHSNLNSTI